jgi:hypothetical protein
MASNGAYAMEGDEVVLVPAELLVDLFYLLGLHADAVCTFFDERHVIADGVLDLDKQIAEPFNFIFVDFFPPAEQAYICCGCHK